jgi:hypothetical protein
MYATQYNDLLVTSMFDCACMIDSIVQNVNLKCFLAIGVSLTAKILEPKKSPKVKFIID